MDEAVGDAQSSLIVEMRKKVSKDWRAAAWLLEHVYSDRYGAKAQLQISIKEQIDHVLDVVTRELGDDAAARVLDAILNGGGGEETGGAER